MSVRFESANTEGLTRTTGILSCNADYGRDMGFRPVTIGARQTVFYNGVTGTLSCDWIYVESDGLLHVRGTDVAGSTIDNVAGSTTFTANTDYVIAVHRTTNTVVAYLGTSGTAEATATISTAGRATTILENIGLESASGAPANAAINYEFCYQATVARSVTIADATSATATGASPYRQCVLTSSADLTDSSGNGRNWTAVGTLSTEANPPARGGGGGGKVNRGGVELDGLGGVGQQRFPRAE